MGRPRESADRLLYFNAAIEGAHIVAYMFARFATLVNAMFLS